MINLLQYRSSCSYKCKWRKCLLITTFSCNSPSMQHLASAGNLGRAMDSVMYLAKFEPDSDDPRTGISKLPGESTPFSNVIPEGFGKLQIKSGFVRLFESHKCIGLEFIDLKIDGDDTNTPNVDYNISGHKMNNLVKGAGFNLPKGVVVTLQENGPVPRMEVVDLRNYGKVVDLVGTGKTEWVDLEKCEFGNLMTAWFWRDVDLELGAVELYAGANYGYPRTVIFLSDWVPGKPYDITDWYINNNCNSIKWQTMDDRTTCTLWDEAENTSRRKLLAGYNNVRETPDLKNEGMENRISTFQWNSLIPQKEVIFPFQIPLHLDMSDTKTFTSSLKYFNNTDVEQEFSVELRRDDAETLTVTTTDSHRAGFSATLNYSAEAGIESIFKVSSQLSVSISYDYTRTNTNEKSSTKTTSLSFTKKFKAPAWKTTVGSLLVRVGTVQRTPFETKARRWYNIAVPGSRRTMGYLGLFEREETVKGYLEGGLRAEVEVHDYYVN